MFLGMRDRFTYLECSTCGTIQIQDPPELEAYYGADYYSFAQPEENRTRATLRKAVTQPIARSLRKTFADYHCGRRSSLTNLIFRQISRRAAHAVAGFPDYLQNTRIKINRSSRILDLGCGAGQTLITLSHFGFRNLIGADPFLDSDRQLPGNIKLFKSEIAELGGEFDLILANHSLEHVTDPVGTIKEIYRLLKPGSYAVVRMPVIGEAWRRYGTNWVQLDAPRHLFIFSRPTFERLASEAGFVINEVRYDSTAFQFWGSEQYERDIPLLDEKSFFVDPDKSIFTAQRIAEFDSEAARLNQRGEGDQAIFYLYKDGV
jgi:SAM-dependent methyltransferase